MSAEPKIITIFNNKGGVGKTTLTYHLANALGEMGKRVLLLDCDPQCNLTIFSLDMEKIHDIWLPEDDFIEDYEAARSAKTAEDMADFLLSSRSIHFLLKPTEDGTAEIDHLPPPIDLGGNVSLVPGRLTLHMYEAKIGERWSGVYQGDPLAIRTATRIRKLAFDLSAQYGFDIVIFDTSPSLGALNRNLLSLADGFIIPCSPDLFSVYGIRNIGSALTHWKKQFESIFHFLSDQKRDAFPADFVKLLGYTLYNAKKYSGSNNNLNLAIAHYNYAVQIPETIKKFIGEENMLEGFDAVQGGSIGDNAIIYTHNTFPSMSQKYQMPMWRLPDYADLDPADATTIGGNRAKYEETRQSYITFAEDFLSRVEKLDV